MDMITSVIEKSERMTVLLKELAKRNEYDNKEYHLVKIDSHFGNYILIRISDKKHLCAGSMTRINSYLNIRGIKDEQIFKDK